MYYFYVIENQDGDLYFGSTNDLKRRLGEHQSGKSKSTKGFSWTLIYYEAYKSEIDARNREMRVKSYGQAWGQLKKRIRSSRQHKS